MAARIGEMLIEKGVLAQDDLDRALEIQKERGDKLGKILTDLGFCRSARSPSGAVPTT